MFISFGQENENLKHNGSKVGVQFIIYIYNTKMEYVPSKNDDLDCSVYNLL